MTSNRNLLDDMKAVVQWRTKTGVTWYNMAAFDIARAAYQYADECRQKNPGFDYRTVELIDA
jgi:hypothetical protein